MTTFTTEDREWAYWHNYNMPKYNRQTEIEFFWPLTEQVSLDLDYTGCERPKLTMPTDGTTGITFYPTTIGNITITGASMNIDVDTTIIKMANKPNIFRRTLYNILGIKWELK